MGSVNFAITQDSWLSELDDEPVFVIGCSTPLCFPSISHVFASTWQKDIETPSEVLIGRKYDAAAVEDVSKIQSVKARIAVDS